VTRLERALSLAYSRGEAPRVEPSADGRGRTRRVAMGDPQAPLEKVLGLLDYNGLLGDDGALAPDVTLVSVGDHFDWGGGAEASRARRDGLALLAWLLAHPRDQALLVAGNHDIGRLGEFAGFDDATFLNAHHEALAAYTLRDEPRARALLAAYPQLPTAELAARDFASFSVAQRELVQEAIAAGRMSAAVALAADVLVLHAGVTQDDLTEAAVDASDAFSIARDLSSRLVAAALSPPIRIAGLHEPGAAAHGEGGGIFYHRPTSQPVSRTPRRRRFDARRLPTGLTQIVGHVNDPKCRELMPSWSIGEPALGDLRTLQVCGGKGRYQSGVAPIEPGGARMIFTDGSLARTPVERYALLDVLTMIRFIPTAR
jgi:hypothetical protein